MPSYYEYACVECNWADLRYRNLKICPRCGAPVHRISDVIQCFHATSKEAAELIRVSGFRADTWFAPHMEDALKMASPHVFVVEFSRQEIPKGWQFHVMSALSPSLIKREYIVAELEGKKCQEMT